MLSQSTKIHRVCRHCGADFFVVPNVVARGAGIYCSRDCHSQSRKTDHIAVFWSKVKKTKTCWLWMGPTTRKGYGQMAMGNGQPSRVHRFAYELLVGPIPEGLTIDHVKNRGCTSRACVNPAHLEVVTRGENSLRGDGPTGTNARKTHCCHGHAFTAANTRITRKGWRRCRRCEAEWMRRKRASN